MTLPPRIRVFYWFIFLACASPLGGLFYEVAPVFGPAVFPSWTPSWVSDLGPNPVETLLHQTGRTALVLLLATLTITPIRRVSGWNRIQLVRRMVGVWSFFYGLCHLLIYVVFNHSGDFAAIWDDVIHRKFIFVGMFTFTILLVLAATSTNGMMRRLGKNWARLHRLVYVAAIAGVVHFAWGQKADIGEPLEWGAYLAVLFAIRLFYARRKRATRAASAVSR